MCGGCKELWQYVPGCATCAQIVTLLPSWPLNQLNGKALAEGDASEAPLLQLYARDGRGWSRAAGGSLSCPSAGITELIGELAAEGRHRRLADFEEHLEQPALDWLKNPGLLA